MISLNDFLPHGARRAGPAVAAFGAALALLAGGADARAAEVQLRGEGGAAFPMSAPQSDRQGAGGGGQVQFGVNVLPMLDLQAFGMVYGFGGKGGAEAGSIAGAGAGPRLLLPRSSSSVSPWIDGGIGVAQTGSLTRLGASGGIGVAFAVSGKSVWIGPFARYFQVLGSDALNIDGADARILIGGLSLELGLNAQPAEPAPVKEVAAAPTNDKDGDGLTDSIDKCPDEKGPPSNDGCPKKEPEKARVVDADGDGVPDADDQCPTVVGSKANKGCPVVDADGDGVADDKDACPKVAGPADSRGCPDSDGDGVADDLDVCPAVPGDKDNRGCPRYKQVVAKYDEKLEISQKVFFAFDKAVILPKSFDLLDEVARVLSDAPGFKVRIEGHTDATGQEKHNHELSENRALAVRDFLIDKGVDPKRLDARGFGSSEPLDSNATADGREKNRRVEFVILRSRRSNQ
jgi:OOP family OmpA-OmpF porin